MNNKLDEYVTHADRLKPLGPAAGGSATVRFPDLGTKGGRKAGLSINAQATRNATKNNTSTADEQIRLDKMLQAKKEVAESKAKPERQAAERNAKTTSEDGVTKTEYPYAGPNEYAKGGSVSARADGIAQRGKTKGRFI